MSASRGFTLIELMIVIAIVAIIAAIAIPSYNEQVRKSRRADAVSALTQMQLKLESWRASCPTYANDALCSGTYPVFPASTYYTLAVSLQSPTGYTLTATPAGAQVGDNCGTFTLVLAAGVTTKTAGGSACW